MNIGFFKNGKYINRYIFNSIKMEDKYILYTSMGHM